MMCCPRMMREIVECGHLAIIRMREGELFGLALEGIDFDEKIIRV
jgi:hypothetical protein